MCDNSDHPFLNFENLLTVWLISSKNYSATHNRMYVCKINHS